MLCSAFAGGEGSSGASSSLTREPSFAYGQPAKLCATNFVAPTAVAAASRLSVPSVRSRFVPANASSRLRRLPRSDSAVAWWTTTSGPASDTAFPTATASRTSSTRGSAPRARRSSTLPGDRVVPTTWWPLARSSGTSRLPITPVAPATKILMISLLCSLPCSRTRSDARL